MPKLKKGPKIALFIIAGVILFGILYYLFDLGSDSGVMNTIAPKGKQPGSILQTEKVNDGGLSIKYSTVDGKQVPVIRIGVVTWGGYAGGQYWNQGFAASTDSRFYKDYGFLVEFIVLDDFEASRNAWKNGEVDLMWVTADAYPTETKALAEYKPQFIFQADWSRGGDAIVVRPGINSVRELKGKKVAVAFGTPSHTFLLALLQADDLEYTDVKIIEVKSAIDAAAAFKANQVDAAVVWSPDDADCVANVNGAKVLQSTKTATHIIADGFFAKKAYVDKFKEQLVQLYEGWMKGAAEINSSPKAKEDAIKILTAGLNVPADFAATAINNVRLTTHGDNLNFFGLNPEYKGVKGEDLYNKMGVLYQTIALIDSNPPHWRSVHTTEIVSSAKLAVSGTQAPESGIKFTAPEKNLESAPEIASKTVRISFATGSAVLDQNAQYLLDITVLPQLQQLAGARVRVEGHTDNVGSAASNMNLSKQRAQSVANYLRSRGGFDPNRFIVVGKGQDEPVAPNGNEQGRSQNRRVEIELIQ